MATGGIATLLAAQPHRFHGLLTIGKIIFIIEIVAFILFTAAISTRFILYPGTFTRSISYPSEALFIPTFFLSIVNIFNGSQLFGVPATGDWLVVALRVCFWLYLAVTFILATVQYLYLFTAPPQRLTVQSMTPSWLLPIFPAMLCGTFASAIASTQPAASAMTIIIAGVTMQGLGWTVSFLMYSAYIQRLMQYGLPAPDMRPGLFIAVGPPSFTGLALIGVARDIPGMYGYFAEYPESAEMLRVIALWMAMWV
jgi:tellurite resistance protein TehA-like permease